MGLLNYFWFMVRGNVESIDASECVEILRGLDIKVFKLMSHMSFD